MASVWRFLIVFFLLAEILPAQDQPRTDAATAIDAGIQKVELNDSMSDSTTESVDDDQKPVDAEKMRKATALMAAVAGIAIFGVGAIATVMLMAKHLRRVARDPGPVQHTAGNDFWFLKPPKPMVSNKDSIESQMPHHDNSENAAGENAAGEQE